MEVSPLPSVFNAFQALSLPKSRRQLIIWRAIRMMKDRGIDALVNDCLISPVLTMGSTFVAYLCALLAFLYLQFTDPGYNSSGTFTPVIMAFSFLIGLQVCQIFTTPIGSGVDTIFVAAAWDPDVLMRDHPDFYSRMVAVYPKVQQMIHAWTLGELMVGSDRIFLPYFFYMCK